MAFTQVRLTVTTQDGCVNDMTKAISVIPIPVVEFSATGPTCLSNLVYFTDNSYSMYGSIHTWIWDFGDGSVITILDPASPDISHLYASNGTFNVILRVATSNGCIATAMNPVMIRPMPVANYSVSSTQCELSPVHFTDQSQINGGSTITQWLWNFNDPVSGSFNNSTIPGSCSQLFRIGDIQCHTNRYQCRWLLQFHHKTCFNQCKTGCTVHF